MNRGTFLLVAAGLLATSAHAQLVDDPLASDATPEESEPPAELKALADTCSAHKFETIVAIPGRPRPSNVKICGEPGQTDAQWIVTLKDSVAKTQANEGMAQSVKDQIVTALRAEIERLETLAAAQAAANEASEAPNIAFDLSPSAPRERAPEYSSLPPLPAPKKAPPVRLSGPGSASSATGVPDEPLVRPKLTVSCAIPHESFAACARLERESQLLVRAGDDLPSQTILRFLRSGDMRAELDLSSLKRGETMREKLPGRVCSGVLRGKVQMQVVTKGRVAETMGPYNLYCGS